MGSSQPGNPSAAPDGPNGLMNALFNNQARFVVDQNSIPLPSPNSGHREAFAVNRTDLGPQTVFLYHRCNVPGSKVPTICLSVSKDGLNTYSQHYGQVMTASDKNYFAVAPTVAKVGNKWVMVFEESPYGSGWAESSDGIRWNYKGVLIKLGGKGSWDSLAISTPGIFVDTNGDIYVFYAGYSDKNMNGNIGFLSGNSMNNLKKYKSPVFYRGSGNSWDRGHVSMPRIIKEKNYYYMVYEGANKDFSCNKDNTYGWGVARSKNMIDWERLPQNPIRLGSPGCGNDMPNVFKRYDDVDFVFHTHQNKKHIVREVLK